MIYFWATSRSKNLSRSNFCAIHCVSNFPGTLDVTTSKNVICFVLKIWILYVTKDDSHILLKSRISEHFYWPSFLKYICLFYLRKSNSYMSSAFWHYRQFYSLLNSNYICFEIVGKSTSGFITFFAFQAISLPMFKITKFIVLAEHYFKTFGKFNFTLPTNSWRNVW